MTNIFAILAYLLMVGVNYLAISLPLGGRDTGAISDVYPNLFAPAGFTFSIWGIIYTLLGVYVVYQWNKKSALIKKINHLFIINALLNASWLFAWHYNYIWLSLLIMFALLLTLIMIADALHASSLSKKNIQFVHTPFFVYFGWIMVATIANVAVYLVSIGWKGFGVSEVLWTSLVLFVGTLIGLWRMRKDKTSVYGFVFVWAYLGILFKHISTTGFAGQYPSVIITLLVCLVIFLYSIRQQLMAKK